MNRAEKNIGHEMEKVEKGYSEFITAKYFYD